MSWTLGNAILQPGDNKSHEENGESRTMIFKDAYADLETKRLALAEGDLIETGWVAKTWFLRPVPGGYGELTIKCVPPNPTHEEGEEDPETVTDPLEDIWSIKSCRNDVSILGYCGPNNASPHREAMELWLKETDPDAAKNNKYHKPDGTTEGLTSAEQALAEKIRKGIDAVIRFYPVITRKRVYSAEPPACLEKLGYIDTPPYSSSAPSSSTRKKQPSGIENAIAAHQWLKVQDDANETSDHKWTRTEAWMGIPTSDNPDQSPWDADLYGNGRWTMPYYHGGPSGNPT